MRDLFEELTGQQSASAWAMRARRIIVSWRRAHGESPTWQELFTELAHEDCGCDEQRARAWTDRWLRNYTLIHWRRNRWVYFTKHHRSLQLQPPVNNAGRRSGSTRRSGRPVPGAEVRSEEPGTRVHRM